MKKYILTEDDIKKLKLCQHFATVILTRGDPSDKDAYEYMKTGFFTCLNIIKTFEVEDDNSDNRKN